MSRRWYRHGVQVAFMGWEPADQAFYLNIVELCPECGGAGEQEGSEEICPLCGGEGLPLDQLSPSNRVHHLTLDQVAERLEEASIPFPYFVRADLEEDQRTNANQIFHEYDLDADLAPG
jgi:hypothetical protein